MTVDWEALGKGALFIGLPLAGFLLGGGWPWKAYRRISDLDLLERLKPHVWLRIEHDAYAREQELNSNRQDEILAMLVEQNKAMLAIAGAVERHSEAIKFHSEALSKIETDLDGVIRDRRA